MAGPSLARRLAPRVVGLILTAVGLYFVWPRLMTVFHSVTDLGRIRLRWWALMFVFEVGSFACLWALQRLTMSREGWFAIATSQLASNAFSRVVPLGAALGAGLNYNMLTAGGVDGTVIAAGLTTVWLMSTAMLVALPVLSIPAILGGAPVAGDLRLAGLLGVAVFVVAIAVGAIFFSFDRPLRAVGATLQRTLNVIRRHGAVIALPERLLGSRDEILRVLGKSWPAAAGVTAGNWLFDYAVLLSALAAIGARPRPSLVLLAYVVSMILGMIPITPGGLGFVEAGLATTLVLAGVTAGDAAVATLAYRLVAFWLPLPIGLVAYLLHRRRYRGRTPIPTVP